MPAAPAKVCPSCGERYDADVLFCSRDGTPLALGRRAAATASSPDADPYIGLEIAGQIVLKSLIGIGSMGRVYRAWQGGIERDVAVKILHRELTGNAELVKRFHREAKVASRLVHPNVVQVLMTGIAPFASTALSPSPDPSFIGGELYLVMEHLDGISLLSALAAAGTGGEAQALPLPRALHVALQLCDAVGEAHAQKIVHRDLKPENVMLVRRGEDRDYVKVLDFGIARLDWSDKGMETQAGLIFGSAKYISPEGAEGQPVGPEGDVYAIATMLYQMLAGRTPFEGESPVAILVQHAGSAPVDLREIARASYVPAPIAAVIMQNLAKKPRERAADARQLRRDLAAAARTSGLFPDDLGAQNAAGVDSSGGLKLAPNQRTKALELSVELAKKIGGVAAKPPAVLEAPAGATSVDDDAPIAAAPPRPAVTPVARPTPAPVGAATPAPISARPAASAPGVASASTASRAGPPAGAPRSMRGAETPPALPAQLDFDDGPAAAPVSANVHAAPPLIPPLPVMRGGAHLAGPPAGSPESGRASARPIVEAARSSQRAAVPAAPTSTPSAAVHGPTTEIPTASIPAPPTPQSAEPAIQGTEQSVEADDDDPPQPRWKRVALAAAVVLAVAPVAVLGGRQVALMAGGQHASDAVESALSRGREAMRKHAWTAPPGANVKELLGDAATRWPSDPRVLETRREAAEMLVSEALGRKYAADVPEAIRLAELALEIDPTSTTAQHLVAELESARPHGATPGGDGHASGAHGHQAHPAAELPEPAPPPPPQERPRAPASSATGPWL
ncbi:MAG TPA: protein kinase [Byssovorax sp.]